MIVIAQQGDTVDALCHRHLGCTANVTEQVLAMNPGLAAIGAELAIGTSVTLPDQAPQKTNKTLIQLWD